MTCLVLVQEPWQHRIPVASTIYYRVCSILFQCSRNPMSYLEGDLRFFWTKWDTKKIIVTMNIWNTFQMCYYVFYGSFFWNNNRNLIPDMFYEHRFLSLFSVAFHKVPCIEHLWDIWKNKALCVSRFYIMVYHKTMNKRGNSRDGCGLHPGGTSTGVTLQSALRVAVSIASNHLSSTLGDRILLWRSSSCFESSTLTGT
jgi:hypothetical protein